MHRSHYDIIIVGAGVAGSALAHALATLPRPKLLQIALIERSFSEPDRIVGELLQPGGVEALKTLNMTPSIEGIDAITVSGYLLVEGGDTVQIPYPKGKEGRSFHHGRFVMGLRRIALENANIDAIEATAADLIECPHTNQVIGVRATSKTKPVESPVDCDTVTEQSFGVYGDLVIVADGCFSNFRNIVMGKAACKATTKSYFVGTVLTDAVLPVAGHGTVILPQGHGPVLLYQISEHDTRMLIDIQHPLPADLRTHILTNILPQLPASIHDAVRAAFSQGRIRRMPNSFLPSVQQGSSLSKKGVILLGDSWNMRHPLTGGGMTVALNDVVYLRAVFASIQNLDDWEEIQYALRDWHWGRKPLSSTINILSGTLYGLFEKDDDDYRALRKGCFKYFQRGGKCIDDPVSLLSGLSPSPLLLASHFFAVIFYAIWVIFTHPRATQSRHSGDVGTLTYQAPSPAEYPALTLKGIRMFCGACGVFLPVLWSEIRWWAPSESF
ncbi:squalene epoxidase [Flammula alnicola]|nr:squalene epoxidase [Flammula alnicola]